MEGDGAIILASRNSSKVNFGRWQRVRKTYENVSKIVFWINVQKLLGASSPFEKLLSQIGGITRKRTKKKLSKVSESYLLNRANLVR